MKRRAGRRGFALVVAMGLLALLVVVLVALAQLGRSATRRSAGAEQRERARQCALAGLHTALGRLQAAAGPDRRVTATAELLGGRNTHWTGVWDATAPGRPPVWLVSGSPDNPDRVVTTSGAARDGVELVGANTVGTGNPAGWVAAPLEDVDTGFWPGAAGPRTLGRFAFWVADEGVKGCVPVTDRVDRVPVPALPDPADPVHDAAERSRLRQLCAHRPGNDAVAGFGLGDEGVDPDRWRSLETVLAANQLRFDFADTPARRAFLREHFHHIGVMALGLLADTARGGLRANWSDPAVAPAWAGDYDRPRAGGALGIDPGTAAPGGRSAAIRPVVTEWALDVVLFRGAVGANAGMVGVGHRLRLELWNPFPVALRDGAGADLVVNVSGLPDLAVAVPGWSARVALDAMVGPLAVDLGGDLGPGEVRVVDGPVVQFAPTGLHAPDATPADPLDDVLTVDPAGGGAFRGEFAVAAAGRALPPLFHVTGLPSGFAGRRTVVPWSFPGDEAFPAADREANMPAAGLRFHVRAASGRTSWEEWCDPAGGARDLRADAFVFRPEEWETANADAGLAAGAAVFAASDPVFAHGRVPAVADFSVQRNLSVGALAHTARAFAPPREIGSPWGGGENRVFDEAFLNPAPAAWLPGDVLPNPRHRVLTGGPGGVWPTAADLRGPGAASHLAVEGAFNVNSVSALAWTLVFGRTIRGWVDAGGSGIDLENPFFHFAQTAHLVTAAPRGRRAFGDGAVRVLAERMREAVLGRGRPFVSLEDFVSSGALQAAIDAAGLNTNPGDCADIGGPPARLSPDFLTQSVVLQTVAPFLAARSDTFTIRAYGEALTPAFVPADPLALVGRAWCEAVVQRLPDYVDPSDVPTVYPPLLADNRRFGRRFRIVTFRWLTADDI